jgi:anti-sigma regulatory factor (Ser/Thr protein kinase)
MTQTQSGVDADTGKRSIDIQFYSGVSEDVPVGYGSVDDIVDTGDSDSIARVVLHSDWNENHPPMYSWVFGKDYKLAEKAQEELLRQVKIMGYSEKDLFAVRLALGEAMKNCLKHAYSVREGYNSELNELPKGYCPISLTCFFERGVATIIVDDYGRGFDLEGDLPIRNGIRLMKMSMDEMDIHNKSHDHRYDSPGTMVVMKRYRTREQST